MDANSADSGRLSLLGSILLGIVSWFSPTNIDLTLKVITAIGAIISAVFAARYYWYATKEKKEKLKRLETEDED